MMNLHNPDAGQTHPDALLMLQAISNPVFALNKNDAVVFGNVAAEQFFKLSSKMLVRLNLHDMVSETSPLIGLVAEVRAAKVSVNEYGLTVGTPRTGGERTVDLQVSALPELEGHVLVQFWPRSIAERIDRQLTHRDAARSITGMASMLAHEIKNPLSGIRGAAQLIEPDLGEEDKALAQLICSETDRIRDLVDQMEVFTDERPVSRDSLNIHEVLDHVIAVGESGFARGREIVKDYDPSLPEVQGSRDQLVQVFLNLMKNACEADRDGHGPVVFSTAFRPGVRLSVPASGVRMSLPLEVSVHNSGEQIAPSLMPHLFEPFVTTRAGGKGLGLALVAKIVSDHSGVVDCESTLERTTFRVLLPKFEESTTGAQPGAELSQ